MVITPITANNRGRLGDFPERHTAGSDHEDDEGLRRERFDEPSGAEQRGPAAKGPSMIAKVAKSKIELMGPKVSMKRRMNAMSQCDGRATSSGSTRSVGIAIWLVS